MSDIYEYFSCLIWPILPFVKATEIRLHMPVTLKFTIIAYKKDNNKTFFVFVYFCVIMNTKCDDYIFIKTFF